MVPKNPSPSAAPLLRAVTPPDRPRHPAWSAWLTLLLALLAVALPTLRLSAQDDALGRTELTEAALENARALPSSWNRLSTEHFELQFPVDQRGRAQELAEQAEAELEALASLLGARPSRPYVVRLAPDEETFAAVQPGKPPGWAAGVAYGGRGLMVLKTRTSPGGQSVATVFRHETVHLLLHDLFREQPIPRWLNEGLARMLAREASIDQWVRLSQGVLFGELIPLEQLETRFPEGSVRAELAYVQSREFLRYLLDRFGDEFLPRLLEPMSQGQSLNEALWSTTRLGLRQLEDDWHAELDRNLAWISAFGGGMTLLWALAALLLVLGYIRKRGERSVRHDRWAVEEAILYGEPIPRGPLERLAARGRQLLRRGAAWGASPPGRAGGFAPVPPDAPNQLPHPNDPDAVPVEAERVSRGAGIPEEEEARAAWSAFPPYPPSGTFDDDDQPPPGGWLH